MDKTHVCRTSLDSTTILCVLGNSIGWNRCIRVSDFRSVGIWYDCLVEKRIIEWNEVVCFYMIWVNDVFVCGGILLDGLGVLRFEALECGCLVEKRSTRWNNGAGYMHAWRSTRQFFYSR